MRYAFLIFFGLQLFQGIAQNHLHLYSRNGEAFKAYAEGKLLNETPQASILVGNILDDTLQIKVEFTNKRTGRQLLYFLEKGKSVKNTEFDYSVDTKTNKVKFTFEGTKQIISLPSPLVPLKPVIDTSAKYRNTILGHYCELKDGDPVYFNNLPKTGDCKTAMPASYLNYLAILMNKAEIDDDKFSIAENTTRNNCISVGQLNKILVHIVFEIEKLKLIKLSYSNLTDKNRSKHLDSTFKLESSKKELASLLQNVGDLKLHSGVTCTLEAKQSDIEQMNAKLTVYDNDSERLMQFKKMYVDNCYSSTQIKLILNKFVHDREKLEAAKLIFFYCTDKENFLNISDLFSYTTTEADLKEFVAKQKN